MGEGEGEGYTINVPWKTGHVMASFVSSSSDEEDNTPRKEEEKARAADAWAEPEGARGRAAEESVVALL